MLNQAVNLMLIEDDNVDVMTLRRALKENRIVNTLYTASNGQEALDKLTGSHGQERIDPLPKIILLDINMPQMNGIEFLKHLRANPDLQAISVFVLTTSDEERDKIDAYHFNVAGYILKPVDFNAFKTAIEQLNIYWNLIEMPA